MANFHVVLISMYEMGRQPFGLASPAAWLRQVPVKVTCLDLSLLPLQPSAIVKADLVAFYLPMHMATRMAVPVLERVRLLNPKAGICAYGLYASENADYLRGLGADFILGGEFEAGLMELVQRLASDPQASEAAAPTEQPIVSLDRQQFVVPYRAGLPALSRYARLELADGTYRTVGYTEASRGCKHLCRHCPIVPVYGGQFRVVQREVVLSDVAQQAAAGARHITFGDPDFFNGPGHAMRLVRAIHGAHPDLTYDVTIKVEHLLKHADLLGELKRTGCLFVTSAVESFDDRILAIFDKGHTRKDFEQALSLCRGTGLIVAPTFVAFTPWTTLESYRSFLGEIARLDLVEQVAPIQYTIRLLIPPGSLLLERPETQAALDGFDEAMLSFRWHSTDPKVDALQRDLEVLVMEATERKAERAEIFRSIWERAHQPPDDRSEPFPVPLIAPAAVAVPQLTEPWYC